MSPLRRQRAPGHLERVTVGCPDCRVCVPSDARWQLFRLYGLTNIVGMLFSAFMPKCERCGHPLAAHSAQRG
jgi:hypothetical protein